jgi:sigma-B regulation protein RsbU (phosphoserine phosphatase)
MATPAASLNHLELLATMSRNFVASLDIQETLHQALALICGYVQSEGGALFLLEGDELVCRACFGPVDIVGIRLGRTQGIVGRSVSRGKPLIVRDVREDPDFQQSVDADSGFTTRSILCAPMSVQERPLGAIELVNKRGADGLFSDPDLMMLETLSSSAALALTNARMQAELVEQEKVKRELELAAEIQRSLLPPEPPDDFPIRGVNRPARTVSGDFYDFYALPDGTFYFAIGDVSGKGMNAALLMSKTASLFRCLGKQMPEPGRLLARINAEVCETAAHGMFVTMTIGRFDPATGRTVLANAGHEPALLLRGTHRELLPAGFPPLGIVPTAADEALDEVVVELAGGQLFLYPDGITESPTHDGVPLGAAGVEALLRGLASAPLAAQIASVIEAVRTGPKQHDDLTLLAVDGRWVGE